MASLLGIAALLKFPKPNKCSFAIQELVSPLSFKAGQKMFYLVSCNVFCQK
jgi:hypothetical protein